MKHLAATVHNSIAWFIFIGSQAQFALIALAYFGVLARSYHAWTGRALMGAAFVMLVTALISRSSKQNILLSIVVFLALFPIQGILVYLDVPQVMRPLHAVNGLMIMWVSYALARGRYRATAPKPTSRTPVATATN